MNIIFSPYEKSKAETLAEKFGFKAGKFTGKIIKVLIFIAFGCTLGLIFLFFALSKGFDKGFHEKSR
jgi:hypothetical protein